MSAATTRTFDAAEPFPWERSPLPGGSRVAHAQSHGAHVDPVLHNPHCPFPDPASGALVVDPDILLKAKGFDLEINLFYNSRSSIDSAYGKKRSISPSCYVLKTDGDFDPYAQVVRGDEKVYEFSPGSTSGFTTLTAAWRASTRERPSCSTQASGRSSKPSPTARRSSTT